MITMVLDEKVRISMWEEGTRLARSIPRLNMQIMSLLGVFQNSMDITLDMKESFISALFNILEAEACHMGYNDYVEMIEYFNRAASALDINVRMQESDYATVPFVSGEPCEWGNFHVTFASYCKSCKEEM